jgi:hypothetical protein
MEYPKYHTQIVEALMGGKFILATDKVFDELKSNEEFYNRFFKISFRYDLKFNQEYAYLISSETTENLSRDISIFFAILCYELDRDGKNFMDELQYAEFEMDKVDEYFENSTYKELIKANNQLKDSESRRKLIRNGIIRRNIATKTAEDRFVFTPASKVFINFALDLAKQRVQETEAGLPLN